MNKKDTAWNSFIRLIQYFPKKILLFLGVFFTIMVSVLTISFSYLLKMLTDIATSVEKNTDQFNDALYILIGLIIFNLLFFYLKTKLLGVYTESGVKKLRELIARKIMVIKTEHLSKSHSGDYLSRSTNDLSKVRSFTIQTLPELIRVPLTAVLALIVLLILSWKLTLISLGIIPILVIGSSLLTKPIGPISKKLQAKLGESNTNVTDFVKGIEVSKAYNLEDTLGKKYHLTINESVTYGKKLELAKSILESFALVLSIFPFIITFVAGGYLVLENEMTVGSLLAFITLLNHVTFPLSQMPRLIGQGASDLASASRILEVLDTKEERVDGSSFKLDFDKPIIQFKNVSFSYPNQEKKVLKHVNFTINYLDSIAFVGPSGSGKSTITKLLLGYYDHYEGDIYIGGHELRDWNLNSLRSYLSYVSQDTFLFPETIKENIQYGNLNTDDNEIFESAKLANANQFIENFELGYKTKVGELGSTLSGGQKQRITIARALIKNTPIILLDEATSALDNESEAVIQDALENILTNKTSVIIAHRLSTIKNVDRIFVIKDGTIIEEGTHSELLKIDGAYNNLLKKQLQKDNYEKEGDLNDK